MSSAVYSIPSVGREWSGDTVEGSTCTVLPILRLGFHVRSARAYFDGDHAELIKLKAANDNHLHDATAIEDLRKELGELKKAVGLR